MVSLKRQGPLLSRVLVKGTLWIFCFGAKGGTTLELGLGMKPSTAEKGQGMHFCREILDFIMEKIFPTKA